jgi:UMF2 family putative MFS family transporter
MLFDALNLRNIQVPIWLCLLPALLFGNLSVLAPLRLSHLGWGAAAIGGTYLCMAAIEASWAPILGRLADRFGRMPPLRAALLGAAIVSFLLPWPQSPWVLAFVIVAAGFAYGSFWTPAMSMVTDEAETFGLDYGYAFALINIAWAPGQAGGAALGGLLAAASSDAVSYVLLGTLCLLTLWAISGYRGSAEPLTAER